jgi:hypothetical protein
MVKSQAFWVGVVVGLIVFFVYKNYLGKKAAG